MRDMSRIFIFTFVGFFAVLINLLGISPLDAKDPSSIDQSKVTNEYEKLFEELKTFTDVLSLVERDYYRKVSGDELVEGAIKGMLTTLDPHSGYLAPDFYQDLKVQTKGEFGGLGIEITIKDGLLVVVAPMEGSPAERAGIKAGDKIVKIEGKFTKEFTLVDAVKRLRGPKGTPIKISVLRKGRSDLIDVTVVRDIIEVRSVRSRPLVDGYGYVRISQFVESTGDHLVNAVRSLDEISPNKQLKGLVLDLRNNPGGLLTQAIRVADLFLKEGVIVYTDGRIDVQKQKFFAQEKGTEPNYPIVVLMNSGSASASEIVAGALQDHGRALVIGSQSFGKGSVQTITPLANGGALTLTTALYFTKSGRSIQATGIKPDIEYDPESEEEELDVDMPEKPTKRGKGSSYREADLPGAISNPSGEEGGSNKSSEGQSLNANQDKDIEVKDLNKIPLPELLSLDPQLKKALEVLRSHSKLVSKA